MKYWKLFYEFFKIGLFTFGGGLAMIPLIQRVVVEKNGWISEEEMINMIAIAESTPGVIAVNIATYVGYKVGKILGSILATLAVVLPSFILICVISVFYDKFMEIEVIKWAFIGIKSAVAILIINAAYMIFKKISKNSFSYILIITSFLIALFVPISTVFIILGGLLIGIIFYSIYYHKKKEVEE